MKNHLLLTLALFLSISLYAQEKGKPITIGYETELESKVLGETRPLLIHLPDNYEGSDRTYPVVYLLDGHGHFHHTTGTMRFLSRSDRMPEAIVVGIPNTKDRTRDLTPPETGEEKQWPTAGGADNMLEFMGSELIPYIDQNYRTTPYKVLIGHSFGGLFAIHALVHRPELFDAYLAISPSLWWDNQLLVEQAETFLEENPEHKAKLYMTMGDEGGAMLGGAWKLAAILEEKAPESLEWEFHLMEAEDHGSIPHRSTYNGFETLFSDWRLKDPLAVYEQGGLEAIQAHYAKLQQTYGGKEAKAPEGMINSLGYYLLNNDKVDEAIEVFAQNVKDYPKSSNVYDSLGEGYKVKGEKQKAVEYYKKSLELNPGNTNAVKMLAEMGVEYKAKEVKVAQKVLKTYVGKYEVEPGMSVSVTLEDGKLYGQPSGGEKAQLIPMAQNKFYLNEENIQAEFHPNDQKEVDRITIYMGEQVLEAKRLK